jgi:hypothetical protein
MERRRLAGICAIFLIGGAVIAQARPRMPRLEYRGMPLDELVSVYEHAYQHAGFVLRERKTTIVGAGHGKQVLLRLALPPKRQRAKDAGLASFKFWSPSGGDAVCSPCSLTVETFGSLIDYSAERDLDEREKTLAAMEQARR